MMTTLENRNSNQFTYRYSQPEDYHFCLDSVILAEFVAAKKKSLAPNARVLDLCSGCGVVGLELSYHLPQIEKIDFLEIQSEFLTPFLENLNLANRSSENFRFLNFDLNKFSFDRSYDLVVCNPPYFDASKGKLGSSKIKNRCHFFLDCTICDVVRASALALKPRGEAFILIKDEQLRLAQFTLSSIDQVELEVAAQIRGTKVLSLRKNESF